LADIVAAAKAQPKTITIANSGTGSRTHFTSVALFKTAGAEIIDVPFGAAQVIPSMLGGQVDAGVQLPGALAGNVKAGQMRLLAAMTAKRDPAFPDVPTAREQKLDVALELWRGIAVPKGTPTPVIAKLQDAVKKTVESPEFQAAGKNVGFTPAYLPAEAFGKLIADDEGHLKPSTKGFGMKKQTGRRSVPAICLSANPAKSGPNFRSNVASPERPTRDGHLMMGFAGTTVLYGSEQPDDLSVRTDIDAVGGRDLGQARHGHDLTADRHHELGPS
jgi:hypothetical protein